MYYAPGRSFPEGVTDSAAAAPADTPADAVDVTTPAAPTPDVPTTEADATAAADIAGSAIISPGTPSAPTAVSPDLDNAQVAYADAQKVLTDAQIALSKITKPDAPDFSSIDYGDLNPSVKRI